MNENLKFYKGHERYLTNVDPIEVGAIYHCIDTGNTYLGVYNSITATNELQRFSTTVGQKKPNDECGEIFNDYINNLALGRYSHAEGLHTVTHGEASHAEGYQSFIDFQVTRVVKSYEYNPSNNTIITFTLYQPYPGESDIIHLEYQINDEWRRTAINSYMNTFPYSTIFCAQLPETIDLSQATNINLIFTYTNPKGGHVEGVETTAVGEGTHAEGYQTEVEGQYGHAEGWLSAADGYAAHAEGYAAIASGEFSHAEGNGSVASGEVAHAEGVDTQAIGGASHAEGADTQAIGDYSHSEGYATRAVGDASHAEGDSSSAVNIFRDDGTILDNTSLYNLWQQSKFGLAKGISSHVEGTNCLALSDYAHAEGYENQATELSAHAEGTRTEASGWYAHAEGLYTVASGPSAHAEGGYTQAKDDCAHAEGYYTIADNGQHVGGKCNSLLNYKYYSYIIGNGASDHPVDRSNAVAITWTGEIETASNLASGGADYAEYFEWEDGNLNNEDRIGYLVALNEDKIHLATSEDDILGIISGTAGIIGDNAAWEWKQKYQTDRYGRVIWDMVEEFVEIPEVQKTIDDQGNTITQTIITTKSRGHFPHRRINANYDASQQYTPRSQRPEWDVVGLMGKLYVRDDGTCIPNSYVKISENAPGIATLSPEKTNIRVLKRIDSDLILVFMK